MKAVLCKQHGLPETLVVEEVPTPVPGAGQVLISVKACGVNFPDTLIIQNLYQFKPPLPFSPGGELSGIVKAVGEGVKHVQVGQPVLAFTAATITGSTSGNNRIGKRTSRVRVCTDMAASNVPTAI